MDAVAHGPDDHGDVALSATELLVGQVVEGAMGHEFDVDAFAFDADEGVDYRIIFETRKGPDLGQNERTDFHLTLRSAESRVPEHKVSGFADGPERALESAAIRPVRARGGERSRQDRDL